MNHVPHEASQREYDRPQTQKRHLRDGRHRGRKSVQGEKELHNNPSRDSLQESRI